ncbi:MAG: hypothetical protein OEW08_06800 [Gammaproteobacteria bacterium]|nr:hypothetical protein [Gammaproteobacteria bacterium]
MTTAISHPLSFSKHPGPRERHLQRKLNNPLFGDVGTFSQNAVHIAQQQDQLAMQRFLERFRELVQSAVTLDKNVESEKILLLKAQLEQQYAVCTGLTGRPTEIQDAIKKLITAISDTLRIASKDDPHALEKLQEYEEHTTLHLQLCDYTLVSDILNPDRIISEDEQIPTLLNESADALQAALALFPPARIAQMIEEGSVLLSSIEAQRHSLPLAWQNLAQMKHWLLGE